MRIGHGFDAHAHGGDRVLRLGGVELPGAPGVRAHSDGDVVLHALMDALLGAAAAGDLGELFPSGDERWRGADSGDLLREVLALLRARGWRPANVDVTVVAQQARIAPHRAAMAANIARLLGIDADRVGVKATTTDGLGALGRGEGVAAHAVALLEACP